MGIADDIVRAVHAVVPGVEISRRSPGRLGGLSRRAIGGVGELVEFDLAFSGGRGRVRLAVPARDDLFVEAVVLVVQTLDAIAQRVPTLPKALHTVSVDRSRSVAGGRRWSGVAHGSLGSISLRADHFFQDDPHRSAARLIVTVAHECWHQVEHEFEVRRYRDSVEFRRRIGEYFGVETLEHVISGSHRTAPLAWRAAREQLQQEVSAYATTSPKEATAELFGQWWLLQHHGLLRPVHEHFGRLLVDFALVS